MATSRLCIAVMVIVLLGQTEVVQVRAVAQVAQFVFGDSLVDQGNNNYLNSIAKANFKPNGIDLTEFNDQPTGRFCNGMLVSDLISQYMGTEPILAYLDPNAKGANLLRGANFGSAGSGIVDDTGAIFVTRLSMTQQLGYFANVKAEIISQIGEAGGNELISKALFSITTGGNDYINNYFLPASGRSQQFSVPSFTTLLINTFEGQLKQLYNLGARKLVISNVGPIGCIPEQLQLAGGFSGKCIGYLQQAAINFNAALKPMVESLATQLPGAVLAYVESYDMVMDLINNPGNYGFTSVNAGCCGRGAYNGIPPCTVLSSLCTNRDQYVFWDAFHPTQRANQIITQKVLYGGPDTISPMSVSALIDL